MRAGALFRAAAAVRLAILNENASGCNSVCGSFATVAHRNAQRIRIRFSDRLPESELSTGMDKHHLRQFNV